MNTRELATEYRLAQWSQMLQERVASEESIQDFCLRKGVSRNTYFYWQRKLREAAATRLNSQAADGSSQGLVPRGWALCETDGPGVPNAEGRNIPIEIGACRVMVGADTDSELLSKVCKVLMSLC